MSMFSVWCRQMVFARSIKTRKMDNDRFSKNQSMMFCLKNPIVEWERVIILNWLQRGNRMTKLIKTRSEMMCAWSLAQILRTTMTFLLPIYSSYVLSFKGCLFSNKKYQVLGFWKSAFVHFAGFNWTSRHHLPTLNTKLEHSPKFSDIPTFSSRIQLMITQKDIWTVNFFKKKWQHRR